MLSFITEQFNVELVEGVFRQRLLMCCIKEALEKRGFVVRRSGDDLFVNDRKLSVSIATKSMTSVLIHTGVNILSDGACLNTPSTSSTLNCSVIKLSMYLL